MGLGGYPDVTLAGALEAARKARAKVREGIDPIEQAKAARSALKAADTEMVTFKEAAEAYISAHEISWKNPKHRAQWKSTLAAYAYPKVGALSVQHIELAHVLSVLEPIWRVKTETASRLRGRMELVLDWAAARGYRHGLNPARWRGHLDKLLPKPTKAARPEHHRALPVHEVSVFMKRLRDVEGTGAKALQFAILTAARSGEVRGATWHEFDLVAKTWTIPSGRMKAGREHRVPLSPAAVDLLKELPTAGGEFAFAAPMGGELSDATLSAVLRRMKVAAVPHGFRSTFRDWAAERTNFPHEVCEMALAHTIGSKAEAAYRRGDLFEKRRRLMAEWAMFCTTVRPSSEVTAIREARA